MANSNRGVVFGLLLILLDYALVGCGRKLWLLSFELVDEIPDVPLCYLLKAAGLSGLAESPS